ncbi:hypothetical protein B0H11DRAFT_1934768 [Mycena galericulata]|nr:hypothetical protein B0H11DRAFT_1934768 [Mycena galericulata]
MTQTRLAADTGTTVGNVRRAGGPISSERNRRRSHGNELRGLEMRMDGQLILLRERAGGPAAGAGPEAWEQVLARPASMGMCPEETRRNAEVERTVRTMRK